MTVYSNKVIYSNVFLQTVDVVYNRTLYFDIIYISI